ncbi:Lin0512 family protein [Alkalibacter saccharofermentans]|nr:Lin0512 family protein [Alkalibacter saccharofermentans]
MKRFVIEFGMGIDFHGQDVNVAASRAVKDAISRSCLVGLNEICGIEADDLNENVYIEAIVGVDRPEELDVKRIEECFPVGKAQVSAVKGGLKSPGFMFLNFGDKDDTIEVAVASVQVKIND